MPIYYEEFLCLDELEKNRIGDVMEYRKKLRAQVCNIEVQHDLIKGELE